MKTSVKNLFKNKTILCMLFFYITTISIQNIDVKANVFNDKDVIKNEDTNVYYWEFGDSTFSYEKKPKHIYSKAGKYTILLIVTNESGCSDSMIKTIEIFPKPVADFKHENVCELSKVLITDSSTVENGTISSYAWNFGNGNYSQSKNPENRYEKDGTYSITQIVSTEKGCIDTVFKTIEVYPLPEPKISANDVCLGDSANFKSEVNISKGFVHQYKWDFGDGFFSTDLSPVYLYQIASTYPVTLQIRSDKGCIATAKTSIKINAIPAVDFTANNLSACGNLDVQFQNYSELKNKLEFNWNFGDGTFSTEENPSHNYKEYGYYDVSLSVKTMEGCSNQFTKNQYLQVYPLPTAAFTLSTQSVMLRNPDFKIINTSSNAVSWNWDFGDGTVENTQNPNHNYVDTGAFIIHLKVLNTFGCEDTMCKTIYVKAQTFIYVPTAFTPNGDGLNDEFKPAGIDMFKKYEIMVFNRWGKKIFESNDFSYGWDGTFKGDPVQDGGYTYMIMLKDFKGKDELLSGTVTVLR